MKTDILVSFDTTGSMYPALAEVRRRVQSLIPDLFRMFDDLHLGIIAHGDYDDARRKDSYVLEHLLFVDTPDPAEYFVRTVGPTHGSDFPECYELVLHKAATASWRPDAEKIFIMIGDAYPHNYHHRNRDVDYVWRDELTHLLDQGVSVFAVQALDHNQICSRFWKTVGRLALSANQIGGHLHLRQLSSIVDMLQAIAYKAVGDDELRTWSAGRVGLPADVRQAIDQMLGKTWDVTRPDPSAATAAGLMPVSGSRFQVFNVTGTVPIQDFVEEMGITFKPGRGFYELTRSSLIQERKEVVLVDSKGQMFTGPEAREWVGLPYGQRGKVSPRDLPEGYRVFVQSTSYNRKLRHGQGFMYEVSSD